MPKLTIKLSKTVQEVDFEPLTIGVEYEKEISPDRIKEDPSCVINDFKKLERALEKEIDDIVIRRIDEADKRFGDK